MWVWKPILFSLPQLFIILEYSDTLSISIAHFSRILQWMVLLCQLRGKFVYPLWTRWNFIKTRNNSGWWFQLGKQAIVRRFCSELIKSYMVVKIIYNSQFVPKRKQRIHLNIRLSVKYFLSQKFLELLSPWIAHQMSAWMEFHVINGTLIYLLTVNTHVKPKVK